MTGLTEAFVQTYLIMIKYKKVLFNQSGFLDIGI